MPHESSHSYPDFSLASACSAFVRSATEQIFTLGSLSYISPKPSLRHPTPGIIARAPLLTVSQSSHCALADPFSIGWPRPPQPRAASFKRNIDGRPFDFVKWGRPFMDSQDPTAKGPSSTALRFASSLCSILKRLGGESRVEMNALRAPLTPLPTSLGEAVELRLRRLSQVLQIKPPQKNRPASSVSQNFLARREERPFVVLFERCLISLRKERPR